jgi:hypothetical protein
MCGSRGVCVSSDCVVGGRGVVVGDLGGEGLCGCRGCVFVLDAHMVVGIMRGRADCVVVRIVWW